LNLKVASWFLLVRIFYKRTCKVIPWGESWQLKVLILNEDANPRIKWCQLISDNTWLLRINYSRKTIKNPRSVTLIGDKMFKKVRKVVNIIFGESKGFGPRNRESWWWNENDQENVRNKKECFKALLKRNNVEKLARYWKARYETRKVMSEARYEVFEVSYQDFGLRMVNLRYICMPNIEKGNQ